MIPPHPQEVRQAGRAQRDSRIAGAVVSDADAVMIGAQRTRTDS
ncbi:hypothetical protein [Streptosporangium sp. NBC_01756]|nr:hypothetical protein [Streptosporangium sp. NBC_01756]WSC85531.1 hypothetical protein OIE48_35035 [Streptosporangium sp. NBC_01756]